MEQNIVRVGVVLALLGLLWVGLSLADETGMVDATHYFGVNGVITHIQSGMLFVKPEAGLQLRTISPARADRVGLHESKVGQHVTLWVDAGNVLVNVRRSDLPVPDHRIVSGSLRYTDPYWSEIQLSTPDGIAEFPVDSLASSKLSVFPQGARVEVELDADNVLIDIHRAP